MTRPAAKERIINELNNRNWSDIKLLEIIMQVENRDKTNIKSLIMASAMANKINYSDVTGSKRTRPYVLARSFCYYILRNEGFSLMYIADLFGKGHATVINGLKKLQNDFDTNYKETIVKFDRFKLLLSY